MLSPLRSRFGIPGVISVIALVFAMFGGAYAATNASDNGEATASKNKRQSKKGKQGGLNAKQKKQVKAIAKSLQGSGPQGPAGPQGLPGANGLPGSAGAKGEKGSTGSQGPQGNTGATGAQGPQGDPGAAGAAGPEGSPWTAGGTLPSGETETGAWAFGSLPEAAKPLGGTANFLSVALSFPIPLAAALDEEHARVILPNGKEIGKIGSGALTPEHCGSALSPEGTAADPRAPAGYLCVYVGNMTAGTEVGTDFFGTLFNQSPLRKASDTGEGGADPAGALLIFGKVPTNGRANGSFAVTAP